MTLSDDEKIGLQAEAKDPRRREIFRRFRRTRMRIPIDDFLRFLEHAANVFDPDGAHQRRQRRISGSRFLL